MKKNVFGRHFKRDVNERKALFKNLLTSLVVNEQIKTSEAKAKAIKAAADKLITTAKKGGRDAYRGLEAEVHHDAVVKLVDDLAGRFANRAGGYTRIIKIGHRVADNAPMAMMEWVEKKIVEVIPEAKTAEKKTKEAPKKVEKKTEKKASSVKISEGNVAKTEKKAVKKAK